MPYVFNALQIRPELDQYRTHRWRSLRELLGIIRVLENCKFAKAEGRDQARSLLNAHLINGVPAPAFDVNIRFPARKAMVNISLEPYITIANNLYGLLHHGDSSDPQSGPYLAHHFYAQIQEFKRHLELRVAVYTRESFEREFHLEWRENSSCI